MKKVDENAAIAIGLTVVTVLLLVGLWALNRPDDSPPKTQNSAPNDIVYLRRAYRATEDHVNKRLQNPDSASYPGLIESTEHVRYLGDNRYQVDSWVEAGNPLGGTVRRRFTCTVTSPDKQNWTIEFFKFL